MRAEDDSVVDSGALRPSPIKGMVGLATLMVGLDQWTKFLVQRSIEFGGAIDVAPGLFRLVHWGNTGAAWSLFQNQNAILAVVSSLAMVALVWFRDHFEGRRPLGRVALGLILGGIVGNLLDRLRHGHVVDFLYFYLDRPNGSEAGFPAFNVADSSICVGVGLLFILAWRPDRTSVSEESEDPTPQAVDG